MSLPKRGLYLPSFEHDNCGAGFICSLEGNRSNDIIHKALEILVKLKHRGAVNADGKTGDGAGILIDIPHQFFTENCEFELPEAGSYATGNVFLPQKENQRDYCKEVFQKNLEEQGLALLGWRKVPVNRAILGSIAMQTEPEIEQIFIGQGEVKDEFEFKVKLYIARKKTEHAVAKSKLSEGKVFYLPSLSTKIIIFKGLLVPEDISAFYTDLRDERVVTRLALVHQRFSTNTFPTWDLAQPFRYICHNGEINTLRGNVARMRSREELLESPYFGEQIKEILPVVLPHKSDSASLDMVVELLLMSGRSLPEVMMMLVPEAWERNKNMSEDKRAFYEYHSCIMEPWDGPASIPFTDGDYIGALLDRNGLRPSRYSVTKDGYVIMSSETGVVDVEVENIAYHGRLEPGKMFLVNMKEGRIVEDEEIKSEISSKHDYKTWVNDNLIYLKDIPYNKMPAIKEPSSLEERAAFFGYTREDINTIILPMASQGKEPIGSMGADTPIAVLSERPQLLYNYFKQLFAQVTNPPLDGIREELITDISLTLGADQNIFETLPVHCRKLKIQNPVISKEDLDKIKKHDESPDYKVTTLSMLYPVNEGLNGIERALKNLISDATAAIEEGSNILILSDRNINQDRAAIPALLACSNLNKGLARLQKRSKISIIIESAEPREVHHFAVLFGFGASAINPYLVNEIIEQHVVAKDLAISAEEAITNYNKAVGKGILKVMNKIGISTLNSYRGSQLFECIGINKKVVDTYFENTPTRIEGIGLQEIELEVQKRHQKAFTDAKISASLDLEIGGQYRWRRDGEKHLFNPLSISYLQKAVRNNEPTTYKEYAKLVNEQSQHLMTLRGMLEFTNYDPIPLEEVEPWTEIVKRFKTGAMSYGSISQEAHENLAVAMNRIGGKSNSGEGGEDVERFHKKDSGDWKNSAIKQVASGRFGVSSNYLTNAQEIQIKMAQGAKPGEGGQLPGPKVNPSIAKTRNSTPYVGLISPPPHHDIYSIEDLSQLIYDLKSANREARINVKLVSEVGVGTVAAGVAKANADVVLISGFDGGTGASPLTSLKHAGLPWELGIAEAQQTLVMNDLRSRVVLECDGQLKTGRDVAIACLLGAEEFGFATAPLVASGCVMMRVCHLNTCPVGIATQNPELRKKFKGKPEHVVNYMYFVAQELREIMARLGFRSINEMVGQVQKLDRKKAVDHFKSAGLDLSPILEKVEASNGSTLYNSQKQEDQISSSIEFDIIAQAHPALFRKEKTSLEYDITNTDRAVGAIISNEISKIYGSEGLPENTLKLTFTGSAGQSFGAFSTKGLTLILNGNTNDYLGKGLSGAKLIIKVPFEASFEPHKNVITGNVSLYGATSGEAYINGLAGERFAVRNSGATAVVEGIGDHGCEYMTGGEVVILGKTGRNFGAGMSGGITYVYNPDQELEKNCTNDMLNFLEVTEAEDQKRLFELVENHYNNTMSPIAAKLLGDWKNELKNFTKVLPEEYRLALLRLEKEQAIS